MASAVRGTLRPVRRMALLTAVAVALTLVPGASEAKKKRKKKKAAPAKEAPVDPQLKRAQRFDKEGKKLYSKQRYDDAIAAFEAGYEAKPLPRLLFNIGRCHEKLGDLPKAVEHFERYRGVAETEEDAEDAETALGIVRIKLKKSRSPVVINTQPQGARLRLEARSGAVIEAKAPFSARLPFEWYRAEAWMEGRELATKEFQVMQGERVAFKMVLPAPAPPPPPPVAAPQPAPTPEPKPPPTPKPVVAKTRKIPTPPPRPAPPPPEAPASATPWIAIGVAVALAGGAAYFGFGSTQEWIARDQLREDRTNLDDIISHDEAAHANALIANVLWGASATALGVGLLTW